jgi:hypothetical protein
MTCRTRSADRSQLEDLTFAGNLELVTEGGACGQGAHPSRTASSHSHRHRDQAPELCRIHHLDCTAQKSERSRVAPTIQAPQCWAKIKNCQVWLFCQQFKSCPPIGFHSPAYSNPYAADGGRDIRGEGLPYARRCSPSSCVTPGRACISMITSPGMGSPSSPIPAGSAPRASSQSGELPSQLGLHFMVMAFTGGLKTIAIVLPCLWLWRPQLPGPCAP